MASPIDNENTKAIAANTEAIAELTAALASEVAARKALALTGQTFELKTDDDLWAIVAAIARKLGATVNE